MAFQFSSLFSAEFVGGAFDAAIENDAANGRVSALFRDALLGAYGLELPASPKAAIGYINKFIGADKVPTVGKGPGSRTGARGIARALHALGVTLHASGACKTLAPLTPLAAWADPVALAAAKVAKEAAKVAKEAAIETDEVPDAASATNKAPTAKKASDALAVVMAGLKSGLFTAEQCEQLTSLASACQRAPDVALM